MKFTFRDRETQQQSTSGILSAIRCETDGKLCQLLADMHLAISIGLVFCIREDNGEPVIGLDLDGKWFSIPETKADRFLHLAKLDTCGLLDPLMSKIAMLLEAHRHPNIHPGTERLQ